MLLNILIGAVFILFGWLLYERHKAQVAESLQQHEEATKVLNEIDAKIKNNNSSIAEEEQKQKDLEEKIRNE